MRKSLWFFLLWLCCQSVLAATQPNIIFILADDLGYGDLSCYGSTNIATPRLDRLAKEGIRFTDYYSASPFCSPSRAALLTGRLPARCGVPYVLFPTEHTGLPPEEVTLAEALKARGYATACIGKWHLGWDKVLRPQQQGFDEFFGLPYSNDSNEWPVGEPFLQIFGVEPLPLMDGNQLVEAPVDQSTLTRRYTERAVQFIRNNRDRPFFLYLPHTMPHVPQYASPQFAGKSKGGLYGDVIEELDHSTGVILDTLQELKLDQNTIVVFTSDNGAALKLAHANPNAKAKAKSNSRFPGHDLGGSNGQLRAGKGTTFEGGVRVPCLMRWPAQIGGGGVESAPVSMMDWWPTFVKLAGGQVPPKLTLDGTDILPLLTGAVKSSPRTLYHYFGTQLQAVRDDRWKLLVPISDYPSPVPPSLWFVHQPALFERQHRLWPQPVLYDLTADPGETKDLAANHPEIVQRLLDTTRKYDARFQREQKPMEILPGPPPPKPGQIRQPDEDLSKWRQR
jgi:arylsulfatase A